MSKLQIDIVSDIACPWCAIGYARLEQALASLDGEIEADVEWHAFELNPDPQNKPQPILQALSRKYGRSEAEMEAAQANMIEIATGLALNFSKMQERYTANTFDGHRLVKWAAGQGQATAMKMALFDAYFGHAENIGEVEVLLTRVKSIGLDADAARKVLASDAYVEEVRSDEARYQQAGVSSVPAFIINNQYLISGAQEPAYLVAALREMSQQSTEPKPV